MSAQEGLAEVLLKAGALSKEQYDQIKLEGLNSGQAVEELIVSHGWVNETDLTKAKAEYYKIPYVDWPEEGAPREALNQFSEQVARRYVVFPFSVDKAKNTLSVVMANPMDLTAVEFLQAKSGSKIAPFF